MREFNDEELRWQASKLAHYVKHGGRAKVWFDSKDFTDEDKRIVRRFWYTDEGLSMPHVGMSRVDRDRQLAKLRGQMPKGTEVL